MYFKLGTHISCITELNMFTVHMLFTSIVHQNISSLWRTNEHTTLYIYTIYRYTVITDFFKYISCSIHVFIFFFKDLEICTRTYIHAIKIYLIRNPGYMLRMRKIRLVRIFLSNEKILLLLTQFFFIFNCIKQPLQTNVNHIDFNIL